MTTDDIRRIEEAVARREDARGLWRVGKTAVEMTVFREATDDLCDELLEQLDDLLAAAKRVEKLEAAIEGLRALVAESRGVVGYHLNGDEAPWDELLDGILSDAREAVAPKEK